MMTWNPNPTTPATLDDASFTPEQQERLLALRARLHDQPDPGEFGLDLRRLEFARWLVQTGRLSDELPGSAGSGERSA
jgi:hypothetical protein